MDKNIEKIDPYHLNMSEDSLKSDSEMEDKKSQNDTDRIESV